MANTKITSKVIADANILTAAIADNAVTGDKVADDVALAGNPTTTTQTAGNSTTRIATTAFVSTAISNLVDSSPAALNTLNELAAALGDDANFSTTVTNSIATKLPLSGGTLTGALVMSVSPTVNNARVLVQRSGDDASIVFADNASGTPSSHAWGVGYDQSASNGFAIAYANNGIPSLTGNQKFLMDINGNATFTGKITADAGIDIDNINIDGTTISQSGSSDLTIDVGGRIDLSADDNGEIRLFDGSSMYAQFKDDSDRLSIQALISDADILFVGNDGGSEINALTIDMSDAGAALFNGNIALAGGADRRIQLSNSGTSGVDFSSNNTCHIRGDNDFLKFMAAGNGGHLFEINGVTKLDMQDSYAIFENTAGQMIVRDTTAGGNAGDGGSISFAGHHASASDGFREFGKIEGVKQNSTGGATQGDLRFYTNSGAVSATEKFRINASGDLFAYNLAGSTASNPTLKINTGSGYIYYDSSSLRYKENIKDFGSALNKVKSLRPVTYDDKALKVASFGLIAEEVNDIAPELVTYKEIDGETKPEAVVYDRLTIHLLKAMQEQQTLIETQQTTINDLKSRIETLEG